MKKCLVILASFNGEKFIKDQIISILNQENVNIEIFVFDDLSTDRTTEIVESINDFRVKLFINKINFGSAALNFFNAFKSIPNDVISKFDFISLSDQDDLWFPDKLINAIKLLDFNNADLYFSNLYLWNQNEKRISMLNKCFKIKKYDYLFEGGSAGCTYVLSLNYFFDLNKSIDINKFKNWENFSHDWYIYFHARLIKKIVVFDNHSYIKYRIHENNVHGQLNINNFNSFKKRYYLIKSGWFRKHINNYKTYFNHDSIELEIYNNYLNSKFSRLYILIKYNFNLIRSKRKFLKFFILSLIE
jgi:rhamnosyltransferase